MSEPGVQSIRLDQIDCSNRLRPVDENAAAKLALSMQDNDAEKPVRRQISPILVRPMSGGGYSLVVGAHRVVAARQLGWQDIDAIVEEMSDDEALEAEVDENLYRKDLVAAELTIFVRQKFEMFTYIGGKLKRGRRLAKSAYRADLRGEAEAIVFYDQIQAKFGIKRRTAEKLLRRAKNIPEEIWIEIRDQPNAYPGALLDKIAALEGENAGSVTGIISDRGCSIREAVKIASKQSEIAVENLQKIALKKAWDRASETVRSAFLREIKRAKK